MTNNPEGPALPNGDWEGYRSYISFRAYPPTICGIQN